MFEVKKSPHGLGLFATELIPPDTQILIFEGPSIDFDEALKKGETQANPLQVDSNRYIDLIKPGVLVNHSCNPNAGIIDDIHLKSINIIYPSDEITFDYSTTVEENCWSMTCRCETKSCRRKIADFQYIPKERRRWYLSRNLVQQFIAQHYEPCGSRITRNLEAQSTVLDELNVWI